MTRSYIELRAEIEALHAEAERVRTEELPGVISRIREAVEKYGISPQDIFGTGSRADSIRRVKALVKRKPGRPKLAKKPVAKKAAVKHYAKKSASKKPIKYRDEHGNSWVGWGPRPKWFRDALKSGKTAAELEVKKA